MPLSRVGVFLIPELRLGPQSEKTVPRQAISILGNLLMD